MICALRSKGWSLTGYRFGMGLVLSAFCLISLPDKLPDQENVFSEKTSIFFKHNKVIRMFDKKHNTLVYLAVCKKLIEGSPQNAISMVPIMP
jgi:catabolite regulation protein CreA